MTTLYMFNFFNSRSLAVSIILLLAGLPSSCLAAYEFVTEFGTTGSSRGQFNAPRGAAVNLDGRTVITDAGNSRVQICTDTGVCSEFGSFGELSGEFDKPRGVAVNSAGRLFIADRGNDRIASCSPTGSCTDFGGSGTAVGKFESPRGIAIDGEDKIYITDTDNNRIQICDDQGVCTAFGSLGSALGQFNSPSGIAVDKQGQIVVADRGNDRIQICSREGVCTAFGQFGDAPGQFNLPAGVAVNSRNEIVIVDRFNDRIQVCTHQGSCTVFGSFGTGPGQFNAPWGVAVDKDDRVIVVDLGNDRVQIFADTANPQPFEMNAGLNDAWFYPVTAGQGFFINVFPDIGYVSLSWFTYDTVRPDEGVTANLGEPGHRWLNALGQFAGNQAVMDITIASGGLFDTPTEITEVNDGTIILTFTDCTSGTVEYDIPSIGQTGVVPIQRVVTDNVALCESIANQPVTLQSSAMEEADIDEPSFNLDPVALPEAVPLVNMNAGLNDAWFYPVTAGQGFFINVFPDIGYVSLSWFTYDTVRPDEGVTANLGEPGHRWLNALGQFAGNRAVMDITIASGGLFDTPTEITEVNDGTIILTFTDCTSGTVEYDIPSIGQTGVVPIQRVVTDNVALCESLAQ